MQTFQDEDSESFAREKNFLFELKASLSIAVPDEIQP